MSLQIHQSNSREEAQLIKTNAVAFLHSLDAAFKVHFSVSKLSEVKQAYQNQNLIQQNPHVISALAAGQDAVLQAMDDMSTMYDYINLHFPTMEDGNNFGVTVQMCAVKQLQDTIEGLSKSMDELVKYFAARADAMDKLQLATETASETQKEENERGKETKTTVTKETKKSSGHPEFHRIEAVYAIDTQYYAVAKKAFRTVKSAYVANVDFLLKNQDKLEAPKGNDGGSNFSAMY